MKEFKNILEAYNKVDFTQRRAVLATVVKVRGSSYRSPGARMLITDDGKWVGSISGGCLEGDALRKARQVMSSHAPLTVTYDTREGSNQNLGIGLGCNGVIDVLIEPIDHHDANNPVAAFKEIISINAPVAMATVFSSSDPHLIGKKVFVPSSSEMNDDVAMAVRTDLTTLFDTKRSEAK